jgi:HlyD family secretion protein
MAPLLRKRRYVGWLKVLPPVVVVGLVVKLRVLAPVPVHSYVVSEGEITREVFGRATIESRREVQLGFDLVGRVTDVLVDEGDRVKLGQVVARLAPEQLNADARAASSGVPLARAAIARLAADEQRARATLLFSEQEATRLRALAASGSVSPRDLDLAEQQLSLAKADLERVRATQAEAQKEIAVASSATESKAATVTRAVLVSPFDGVVIRRFKDPGDTVVVGTTVLRVVAVDRLWARAAIDESMLSELHEGLPAEVALLGEKGEPLRGTVDRVGREVDRQTHEVLVDVLLSQPPTPLAIGHRADVHIELGRAKEAARIPLAFVRRDADGAFVMADRDGRVARVPIQVGAIGRDLVGVSAGLRGGETVLDGVTPGAALAPGRRWATTP